MSRKYEEQIKLLALDLPVGQSTYHYTCPKCNRREGNFSITRGAQGLFYNCFRATCGLKGFVGSVPLVYTTPTEKKPKLFAYDTETLPKLVADYLTDKFPTLTLRDINQAGLSWAPELERVIFPLKDYRGYIWGYNARYYTDCAQCTKLSGPKAILYQESVTAPVGAWFGVTDENIRNGKVVLVEDCMSAVVLAEMFITIACMGHNPDQKLIAQLKNFDVTLVFDNDVLMKSFETCRKYHLFVKNMRVIDPVKDPKDMSFEELEALAKIIDGT